MFKAFKFICNGLLILCMVLLFITTLSACNKPYKAKQVYYDDTIVITQISPSALEIKESNGKKVIIGKMIKK